MKRVLIDTNVILRFLLFDIPQQTNKVKKLFEEFKSGKIKAVIPEVIFFETKHTLSGGYYKFKKDEVIDKLEAILSANYLEVESKEIFLKALNYYKKTNLSLVDSFLIAKARLADADIFTFDKDLQKSLKSN